MEDVYTKYYSCAGVTIKVRSDFAIGPNTFHAKFKMFEAQAVSKPEAILHHYFHEPDAVKIKNEKILFKNSIWSIGISDKKWIYRYKHRIPASIKYSALGIFDESHHEGEIYYQGLNKEEYLNGNFLSLLLFNNDQLLLSRLLAIQKGIILHGNGILYDNQAILLTGASGSGKSTLSAMLEKKGMEILCDDRMIVKKEEGKFKLYGSWIHGSIPKASSGTADLKLVFFLEQSNQNNFKVIKNKQEKVFKLVDSMIKSFNRGKLWIDMLTVLGEMVNSIPMVQLYFNLDGKIIPIIQDLMSASQKGTSNE
ncbi:hypothetical protein [Desulfobacter postgatei]|uniref:hypothetical protein n=1 Tax=Desulfobacter postgatei TaxID=2293 RepID=UPI00259B41BE|nr:hypothetical protein [uncultured Desulfobacter sp.]